MASEEEQAIACSIRLSKMDCADGRIFIMPLWLPYRDEQQYNHLRTLNNTAIQKREALYASKNDPNVIAQEWTIPSSNGKQNYLVILNEEGWKCSCIGFGFRKTCKHIEDIKSKGGLS